MTRCGTFGSAPRTLLWPAAMRHDARRYLKPAEPLQGDGRSRKQLSFGSFSRGGSDSGLTIPKPRPNDAESGLTNIVQGPSAPQTRQRDGTFVKRKPELSDERARSAATWG